MAMTNGTAVQSCPQTDSKMGNYYKSRMYTSRSATLLKTASSPTKKISSEQNEMLLCDRSKLRPKSTESSFVIPMMPNSMRHGSPKLKSSPRASPSKEGNCRSSPTIGGHYAGAKFSEPPAPTCLPKPPHHWTSFMSETHQLKLVLNVEA